MGGNGGSWDWAQLDEYLCDWLIFRVNIANYSVYMFLVWNDFTKIVFSGFVMRLNLRNCQIISIRIRKWAKLRPV